MPSTMEMSINKVRDLCTGCGSCQAVCSREAIALKMDALSGFFKPVIDGDRCIECGLCIRVCPGEVVNFHFLEQTIFGRTRDDQLLGVYEKCYVGYSTDQNLRYKSSSGGLVTELIRTALSMQLVDGVAVTALRITPDGSLQTVPYIARNNDEVLTSIGSKYAPVAMNTCIEEIIKKGGHYGVVGLPCHIHGIRKIQEAIPVLKERIKICIGLFCAKNIRITGTYYLLNKLNIEIRSIKSISYRGKGWPGGMTVEYLNGRSIFIDKKDYFTADFDAFTIPRCSLCCDQTNELADISCGDAWHIVKNDTLGSSIVIVRSNIGSDLLSQGMKSGAVKVHEADRDAVIKTQGGFSYKKRDIVGRLILRRIAGKRVPDFPGMEYYNEGIITFLRALSVSFKMVLSTRKFSWPLLRAFCRFTERIANTIGK